MNRPDPFTGTWIFRLGRSELSGPMPRSWVEDIRVTAGELVVREEIVSANGDRTNITVQARFDGERWPVHGSPIADEIAYTRVDNRTIDGVAWKNQTVSLRETLTVAPDGNVITLNYSVFRAEERITTGTAVFERTARGSGRA